MHIWTSSNNKIFYVRNIVGKNKINFLTYAMETIQYYFSVENTKNYFIFRGA